MFKTIALLAATVFAFSYPTVLPEDVVEPVVQYTSDSVVQDGILYDPVKLEDGSIAIQLTEDFDFGYKLYDDPETEIIDGIRINGQEVTSMLVTDWDYTKPLTISVKTVYKSGIEGTLAQIADGTYDYSNLLSNPLMLMQTFYYLLAALSLIIGGFGLWKSRKAKSKTASEIASAVDARAKEAQEQSAEKILAMIQNSLTPAVQKMLISNGNVVKAMALSTSKTKESALALLDLLKDASDTDVSSIIENAKTVLNANSAAEEEAKQNTVAALDEIVQSNQEATEHEKSNTGVQKSVY